MAACWLPPPSTASISDHPRFHSAALAVPEPSRTEPSPSIPILTSTSRTGSLAIGTITADSEDPDQDGLANLLEFATGNPPNQPNGAVSHLTKSASSLEFTYRRSHAALADDVEFIVEWSPSLSDGWSAIGITQFPVPETDDGVSTLWKAILPAGIDRRFMRLKTTLKTETSAIPTAYQRHHRANP